MFALKIKAAAAPKLRNQLETALLCAYSDLVSPGDHGIQGAGTCCRPCFDRRSIRYLPGKCFRA